MHSIMINKEILCVFCNLPYIHAGLSIPVVSLQEDSPCPSKCLARLFNKKRTLNRECEHLN